MSRQNLQLDSNMKFLCKTGLGFVLILGLFVLAGCGPMYQTEYSLVPPKSEAGSACTYHCETAKLQCRQIEELRVDRCELQGREENRECESRIRWQEGRSPKWYECGSGSCSADYDQCVDHAALPAGSAGERVRHGAASTAGIVCRPRACSLGI